MSIRLRDLPPAERKRLQAVARVDARPPGMNKTEARRADALEILKRAGEIADYRFEAMKLRLGENVFYTPDFLIVNTVGEVVFEDVKGRKGASYYATDDARVKIKTAAQQYPWFHFFTVWEAPGGAWKRQEVRPW